jgi:hypothetical protein
MGLKRDAIGNTLGEHIGNSLDLERNILEKKRKNEKNPPLPPNLKEK